MTEAARIQTYGCEKHPDNTYEGCYSCDLEDMSQMGSTIQGMRQALRQIKRWVTLARCGDLTPEAAYKQIEIDADRCLPSPTPADKP